MSRTSSPLAASLAILVGAGGALAGGGHGGHGHGHGDHGHGHGDHGGGHAHDAAGHHQAPDPHQALARHGGAVMAEGDLRFEAVFSDHGVRLYPMDAAGMPVAAVGRSGSLLLKARRGRRLRFELAPSQDGAFLQARADLSGVEDGSRTAIFTLKGFRDGSAGMLNVWTRFERSHHEHGGDGHGGHGHGDSGDDHGHGHGGDDHGHGHGGHDDHGHGGHGQGDDHGHGH